VLESRPSTAYPKQALEQRLEASVGLVLKIDASGAVVEARVIAPAGHGFDEAALAAAREFIFEPAKRAGVPIASTVHFDYEFHLPPEIPVPPPPAPAPATAAPSAPPAAPSGATPPAFGASAIVMRPLSAASSFAVRDRDFALRPIGSVQDILRVTPGLVLVQHSGGGKANQYFIRGFDADHGTDLALSIDGIPINLVAHAHGQGFSDTNFIIPEVVERVEITKGPYFASQGDFATGGAINLVSRNELEQSSVGFGSSGSPGHGAAGYRALVIASPKLEGVKSTFAADISRSNGPFDSPDDWDKYKLFNKISVAPSASSSFSLMVYGHGFHSNDVRGVFATPSVTPLTRAIGEEVGARARLFERWDLAVAFWQLDLANETVWVGDEGTTEVSGATRRRGVELETRYELTRWLAADLDLTFTHADLRANAGNGNGLALAPKQTWSGGLSARHELGPGIARGGLRFYGIGDRPASDDGALIAPGFTQVDLHLGYRYERFDLAFDIENLLNGTYRAGQFDTTSRLPTEPAVGGAVPSGFRCGKNARLATAPDGAPVNGRFFGCEDVSYTPAYPFTARMLATLFLD
jgi:TonB family protein